MSADLRVVALEEHIVTAEVIAAWQNVEPRWRDLAVTPASQGESGRRLAEIGDERIASMDKAEIDVQVLSLTAPGVQNLEPADATMLQREVNDLLADTIRTQPDRFQAFATLATPAPDAAAAELDRAVTQLGLAGAMIFGRTRDQRRANPVRHRLSVRNAADRGPRLPRRVTRWTRPTGQRSDRPTGSESATGSVATRKAADAKLPSLIRLLLRGGSVAPKARVRRTRQ